MVHEYWEFTHLLCYVPIYLKDECFPIRKFILGLNSTIGGELDMHGPTTMDLVYEKSIKQEQKLKEDSNRQEMKDHKRDIEVSNKITPKKEEPI